MRLLGSRVVGQAALYTVASGVAMGLSGVAKAIFARHMSPSALGSFSFAVSFLTLLAGVFDFGLFNSAARRLAMSDVGQRRELLGACVAAFVPLAVLASAATFGFSFVVDSAFHVHAAGALRACAPLAWAWVFALVGELLAKGADRLYVYSVSNLVGSVVLVVLIASLLIAGVTFSTTLAFLLATVSMVFSLTLLAVWLRPRFRRVRTHVTSYLADSRVWAFHVYVGRLSSIGTYNMDVLMVAWFSNARSTGYYALAGSIAAVMGIPMLGVAAALYPRMALEKQIGKRWIMIAWAMGGVGFAVVVLVVEPLIPVVFGKAYAPVGPLTIPLVIGGRGSRRIDPLQHFHVCPRAWTRDAQPRVHLHGQQSDIQLCPHPPVWRDGRSVGQSTGAAGQLFRVPLALTVGTCAPSQHPVKLSQARADRATFEHA